MFRFCLVIAALVILPMLPNHHVMLSVICFGCTWLLAGVFAYNAAGASVLRSRSRHIQYRHLRYRRRLSDGLMREVAFVAMLSIIAVMKATV